MLSNPQFSVIEKSFSSQNIAPSGCFNNRKYVKKIDICLHKPQWVNLSLVYSLMKQLMEEKTCKERNENYFQEESQKSLGKKNEYQQYQSSELWSNPTQVVQILQIFKISCPQYF